MSIVLFCDVNQPSDTPQLHTVNTQVQGVNKYTTIFRS